MNKSKISWEDFKKIDIRVGTVLTAEPLEKAIKPAIKMSINFSHLGILKTSAQITTIYKVEDLPGKQVLAVVNLPPKQITDFMSECLVLGLLGSNNEVTLIVPDQTVENGLRLG